MRLRPPLPTWVGKANFAKGIFYPVRIGFERPPSAEARSMDLLLSEMDEAQVEYGVIMGRQSVEPLGSIPNDEIAACIGAHPGRFLGWGGIDLDQPMDACLREMRRCVSELGFKGVSIEPSIARDTSFARADDQRLYPIRSEEHTSELQSQSNLVCRLLLEKKKKKNQPTHIQHNKKQNTNKTTTYPNDTITQIPHTNLSSHISTHYI